MSISDLGLSVLLLDDQDHMLQYSKTLLEKLNAKVICAQNGAEGLQALAEHDFDVILSDLIMPEMDGYEFCEEVRRNPKTHSIPIVIHSSQRDSHDVIRALRLGADDFVAKTCSVELLESVLERTLSRV